MAGYEGMGGDKRRGIAAGWKAQYFVKGFNRSQIHPVNIQNEEGETYQERN